MSTLDLESLEAYLFTEDKQTYINKLVPGTEKYLFFSLLHSLHTSTQLTPEVEAQINEYKQTYNNQNSINLAIRALLKKFDNPSTSQQDKEKIIDELNSQYLYLNFDYPKPANITGSGLSSDQKKLPSALDNKLITLESQINKAYSSVSELNQFSTEVYSRLDTKKISEGKIDIFETFLWNANPTDFEDFPKLIVDFLTKSKKPLNFAYQFFNKLSLEQLYELAKLNPNFASDSQYVQALCRKEFGTTDLYNLGKDLLKKDKRDLFFKLYTWAKKQQNPFVDLISNILYQILQLDLGLNQYDKELFIEYLKNPKQKYVSMSEKHRQAFNNRAPQQSISIGSDKIVANELIKQYLSHFFVSAQDTKPFNEYLESDFLNEIFYAAKLMAGFQLESTKVLSPEKLKILAESKDLIICQYNQEYFKGSDAVKLDVTLKNIPSLMIKIFEFKPENYYLKTYTQLDGSINLDGLIAAEESNIEIKESPIRRITQTFTLQSLSQKKQGIFIVDFIGNGLSSRAVIRKGKITFIEQQTVAGQQFTLIDEDANVCKGGRTGIWIKNHFYRADDKGRVLVPFSSNESVKAVIVHNEFAELKDIQLRSESFEFKCGYIYNFESFLMGSKAKVLVQPRLFLNQQPTGLDILQDPEATVTITNEDGIPSKFNFDKLKLSANAETELEFPVPAKLREVNIEVKAKILPVHKREPVEYTSHHRIPVEPTSAKTSFCNLYLRYSSEGYSLYVLGKNGEPKQGLTINFNFKNKYFEQKLYSSLQTDNEGRISLGKLEEIIIIEAILQPLGDINSISRYWNINSHKSVNYPENIRILEGDEIVLPLLHNELNRHYISFNEVLQDGSILSNHLKNLKIDKKRLIISDLKEGNYNLRLKDVNKTVSITVYKGNYWAYNKSFLLAKDTLIDIKSDINNIVITNFKVENKNNDVADITLEAYTDLPKIARFHIFGAQFVDMNLNKTIDSLDANLPEENHREAYLGLKQSQFLNNRSLGDEYCYVLDRKNQTRFLGNTLEKPPVLLKKTFVRDTTTTEESLKETEEFVKVDMKEDEEREYILAEKNKAKKKLKGNGSEEAKKERARRMIPPTPSIDPSLNFLENACLLYSNLRINDKGTIVLKDFPIKKYSFLQVIASNLSANISEIFPLDSAKIPTKDLKQKGRNNDAVFSINRSSSNVPKGDKIQIKDLTSTEIQVIDSLPKLFDIQKNLVLSARSGSAVGYEKWAFLITWEGLKHEEKLKKYDKFASHELNLFLYFKDRQFFDQVILPFLRNKIEKTIVDHFFLSNQKKIQECIEPGRFERLNSLEQVLVILSLKATDEAQAKRLVEVLENRNSLNKIDISEFNRLFDTVLTSKTIEKEEQLKRIGGKLHGSIRYDGDLKKDLCMASFDQPEAIMRAASPYGVSRTSKKVVCEESSSDKDFSDEEEDFWDEDDADESYLEVRGRIQLGFQELEKTKEYTERHYYEQVGKSVWIGLNSFWVDIARHIVQKGISQPFLTQNFIYANSNHTELIAALSFLSLPFRPEDHSQTPFEGRGIELKAASDLIVLKKAVAEAQPDLKGEILITQRFFDQQEKYTESEEEPGVQIEKEVDQYITNKIYGSTVIVTNSSASRQQLQVLVEIPEGAIPVSSLDYTKNHNLDLNAFSTQTIEFLFYFPETGKYKTNPPNASKRGKVVAVGKSIEIEVKKEKTYATLETLTAVLTKGSQEDVLNFARTKNIWNSKVFDFKTIYWLLADKNFWTKFIEILRERKYFDAAVWHFGIYHKDARAIREYFNSLEYNNCNQYFHYINSSLLQVDKFKLLEYNPFINQRVHLIGDSKNRILNVQLKEQYKTFLSYLIERNTLTTEHYLGLIYYLLLQDRIEEAIRFFGKIDREEVRKDHQHELQYDYFAAYTDFYMGYPKFTVAREICQKYLTYPVLSWRSLFIEVANQLAEFDGEEIIEDEATENTEKRQNVDNAKKEEVINMEINEAKLIITIQNVSEIALSFYKIDLEVLFSRNPFITQSKDEFSFIQSTNTHKLQIENTKGLQKMVVDIPDSLQKYNLHIELKTENKTLSSTYFSTSLKIHIIENYGQVKVLDKNDKPLSKTYVKCFVKAKSGKVSFYKDGYTDLRGRFDYATLNSNDISNIEKFAIFIMNDDFGSVIKEAQAPNKLSRVEPQLKVASVKRKEK